jgi:hypothetical protein
LRRELGLLGVPHLARVKLIFLEIDRHMPQRFDDQVIELFLQTRGVILVDGEAKTNAWLLSCVPDSSTNSRYNAPPLNAKAGPAMEPAFDVRVGNVGTALAVPPAERAALAVRLELVNRCARSGCCQSD